ncbi:hypothetical protein CSOJ01_01834 [Colletotrichum sojae]|uniref:Uncharacterized protein n=1 Tax=Colletotrichum sojae TaxID=2175907 RepID=A0A8H6JSC6_9PEZI|nr:hypothetical protein CSOJ01_01834 [Colletotrichum sojae]
MSGLEIAGIVLCAVPVAITALEKYGELARRLGLFNKIRPEHKRCSDRLCYFHVSLKRHLRQLLLPLTNDDLLVEDLLSNPGGKGWTDPTIVARLQERLQGSYELYVDYIQEVERVMRSIHQELAFDLQGVQGQVYSEKEKIGLSRLRASFATKESRAFQVYRLKFANGESKRNELFAELDEYCNKMEKLLDSSDRDAELVQKRAALKHMNAVDAAVCSFWPSASKLFHVLAASWNCLCQGEHFGQLRLQHRTTTELDFRIIFKSSASSSWVARSTRISGLSQHEQATERRMLDSVPIRQSAKSKPQIIDLCASLKTFEGHCYGYVAGKDCRFLVFRDFDGDDTGLETVTLEQILLCGAGLRPSRQERYSLALVLASSVLQLLDTPWLPERLKKTEVVFLANSAGRFHLDQPQSFRKNWRAGDNDMERAAFDLMAARDWQREVMAEAGPDYSEAVAWCLGGNRSAAPDRWRQEMLRKVAIDGGGASVRAPPARSMRWPCLPCALLIQKAPYLAQHDLGRPMAVWTAANPRRRVARPASRRPIGTAARLRVRPCTEQKAKHFFTAARSLRLFLEWHAQKSPFADVVSRSICCGGHPQLQCSSLVLLLSDTVSPLPPPLNLR